MRRTRWSNPEPRAWWEYAYPRDPAPPLDQAAWLERWDENQDHLAEIAEHRALEAAYNKRATEDRVVRQWGYAAGFKDGSLGWLGASRAVVEKTFHDHAQALGKMAGERMFKAIQSGLAGAKSELLYDVIERRSGPEVHVTFTIKPMTLGYSRAIQKRDEDIAA